MQTQNASFGFTHFMGNLFQNVGLVVDGYRSTNLVGSLSNTWKGIPGEHFEMVAIANGSRLMTAGILMWFCVGASERDSACNLQRFTMDELFQSFLRTPELILAVVFRRV